MDLFDTKDIVQEIVIGVLGTIAASVILFVPRGLKARLEYRNQRVFLTRTIEKYRDLICGAQAIEVNEKIWTMVEVRHAHFKAFQREMDTLQQGRTSRLSFNQKQAVFGRLAFFAEQYPEVRLNLEGYREIFDELEAIPWLRLKKPLASEYVGCAG